MGTHSVISIDAMSGDLGAEIVVRAAHACLERHTHLDLILVGDETELTTLVTRIVGDEKRLLIRNATEVVGMSESPADALRKKKDSSMRVAINLVKEDVAEACVSAGNTGALMATARFVLKTLPGIKRPAIVTAIPTMHGYVHFLDLGANVDSSAEVLQQFGIMGSILVQSLGKNENPTLSIIIFSE